MRKGWHRLPKLLAHYLRQVHGTPETARGDQTNMQAQHDGGDGKKRPSCRGRFGTGGLVPVLLRRRTVGVVAAGGPHMHGYPPESVTPTTELVLSHKHPDDYRQIADTLALIRQTRQAFGRRHRIRDVQGALHHVVVVGDQLRNGDGSVIGTHGFYIDITPAEQARTRSPDG